MNSNILLYFWRSNLSFMKKVLFILILLGSVLVTSYSQGVDIEFTNKKENAITIGLFNGGSLLGAELETLISGKVGAHIGLGFIGACLGLNYHMKPTTNSSFVSIELRNQGVGEIFTDLSLGLGYVIRYKGISAQVGAAYILKNGPNTIDGWNTKNIVPQISLGYFSAF